MAPEHAPKIKLNYWLLKVRYYCLLRNLDKTRSNLYKMDLMIRDQFENDFRYRTCFLIE